MFKALSERNYRVYLTGSIVSNVGTWMQRVAQDWLVLEVSGGSGVAVGITTALQFLPTLLLPGITGLAADRFDKRTLLRISQAWMATWALILGLLAVTGVVQTWHVYLIAALFGIGSAFDVPARQSFVSEVVGGKNLANAISLNSASFNAARLIGPGLAGLVIHQFGSGWAILSNAISYLAFIVALSVIDAHRLYLGKRVKRGKRQIREAMSYIRHRPDIVLVLCVLFFVGTFGLNFQMTSALMTTQIFHLGPQQYGVLGTIMALGSLTGALVGARRNHPPRLRFMIICSVAFGALLAVSGLMPTYLTYAITLPVVGLASMLCMNAANTIVQMSIDPQLRGRVMAVYFLVMQGGTPLGAPLLGWIAQDLGARSAVIFGGGMVVIGALVSTLVLARVQGFSLRTLIRPARASAGPTVVSITPTGPTTPTSPTSPSSATPVETAKVA